MPFGRNREARHLLYLCSLYPIPFENLLQQKLRKIMRPNYSDTLQMRQLVRDMVQVLWLFLWNTFANCTISPHFCTVCSLLFNVVSSLLWQFQTAAVMPPTSIATMSSSSSKQVVCFDPSYTRARKCSPMQISAGGCL